MPYLLPVLLRATRRIRYAPPAISARAAVAAAASSGADMPVKGSPPCLRIGPVESCADGPQPEPEPSGHPPARAGAEGVGAELAGAAG
ncbi:MAG: hypothetical protein ACJ786_27215, partial [Catenulispora sp.]